MRTFNWRGLIIAAVLMGFGTFLLWGPTGIMGAVVGAFSALAGVFVLLDSGPSAEDLSGEDQ